jgi:copper homeostasis protein (lipoprotein)
LGLLWDATYAPVHHGHVQDDSGPRLRHNRVMSRLRNVSLVLVLVGAAAACDRMPSAPYSSPEPLDQGDGRVAWRGVLPCADCEGVDTFVVLERRGEMRRYELVEIFVAGQGSTRFSETGEWRLEGARLRLAAEGGAERHFALLHDGRLQPRDANGRAFRRRGDFLQPTEARAP